MPTYITVQCANYGTYASRSLAKLADVTFSKAYVMADHHRFSLDDLLFTEGEAISHILVTAFSAGY